MKALTDDIRARFMAATSERGGVPAREALFDIINELIDQRVEARVRTLVEARVRDAIAFDVLTGKGEPLPALTDYAHGRLRDKP